MAQIEFKTKIANMVLRLNKAMGNAHTQDEITFVASEIWRSLYFKNPKVPLGLLYRYYEDAIAGKVGLKKITVQTLLSSLNDYIAEWKEKERKNAEKFINAMEDKARAEGKFTTNSPIVQASVWLINMRCDGYDVDNIYAREVAEVIESGKNPYHVFKPLLKTIISAK
jgi:hypothetical protein